MIAGADAVAVAAVAAEVRRVLAEVTGRADLDHLSEQTPLFGGGVGLDSLSGTLLLRQIQRRYGVDVAAEDLNLDSLATLGTLVAFVAERRSVVAERGAGGGSSGGAGVVEPAEPEPQEQQGQRHGQTAEAEDDEGGEAVDIGD